MVKLDTSHNTSVIKKMKNYRNVTNAKIQFISISDVTIKSSMQNLEPIKIPAKGINVVVET